MDLPKRRGLLTQMNRCSVSNTLFVYLINPVLSTYILELRAISNPLFDGFKYFPI
jgi:hypothetical protein